ncbi:hypothetical protein Tco_0512806, partial [Tanacetum coccineum]
MAIDTDGPVGGANGIAGARFGTSPELIGPGVNRIGVGPELNSLHYLSGPFVVNSVPLPV